MTAPATSFGGARRAAIREFGSAVATIMVKELRSRMRGRRAFVVLTAYLGLLALITYGVYVVVAPSASAQAGFNGAFPGAANVSAIIGQSIFSLLSIFQLILICFIAPGFTAGQISLEREKQTLDLLISTPLRPGAIVVGKLLAALAFVVLMIVAAIPITAIVLMYGGASVDDIVRQQLVLLATALGLGSIGLFYSALLKRTQAATVLTYITVLALTLGTVMLFIFWSVLLVRDDAGIGVAPPERAPEQLMYVNPGVAMLDVIANTEPGGFGAISSMLGELRGESFGVSGQGVVGGPNVGPAGGVVCEGDRCFPADDFGRPIADLDAGSTSGYWWPRFALTFVGLSALLTLFSMRLVVPAGMRWAFRRRRPTGAAAGPPMYAGPQLPDAPPAIEELPEPER
jgi:ABC-2 type transport system permease protein